MTSYHDIYTYSASILWTAYGIAIGVTLIGVCFGIIAHFINHGSYTTKYSTILRTTQRASISTNLHVDDCDGKNPLPKHLAKATVLFTGNYPADMEGKRNTTEEIPNSPSVDAVPMSSLSGDETGVSQLVSRSSREPISNPSDEGHEMDFIGSPADRHQTITTHRVIQ